MEPVTPTRLPRHLQRRRRADRFSHGRPLDLEKGLGGADDGEARIRDGDADVLGQLGLEVLPVGLCDAPQADVGEVGHGQEMLGARSGLADEDQVQTDALFVVGLPARVEGLLAADGQAAEDVPVDAAGRADDQRGHVVQHVGLRDRFVPDAQVGHADGVEVCEGGVDEEIRRASRGVGGLDERVDVVAVVGHGTQGGEPVDLAVGLLGVDEGHQGRESEHVEDGDERLAVSVGVSVVPPVVVDPGEGALEHRVPASLWHIDVQRQSSLGRVEQLTALGDGAFAALAQQDLVGHGVDDHLGPEAHDGPFLDPGDLHQCRAGADDRCFPARLAAVPLELFQRRRHGRQGTQGVAGQHGDFAEQFEVDRCRACLVEPEGVARVAHTHVGDGAISSDEVADGFEALEVVKRV